MLKNLENYFQLAQKKPNSVYRIAETGFNHEGDLNYMLHLIRELRNSGADAVKFHVLLNLEEYMVPKHSLFSKLKQWLLTPEQWITVFTECKKNNLAVVGLADDISGLKFLIDQKIDALAIHASSLHDIYMLRELVLTKQPLFIGVGGATSVEIEYTINKLSPKKNLILMYGLQQYPTPLSSLHLKKIIQYEKNFGFPVGYADHAGSQENLERAMAYAAAYALGARILEQHVTLDLNSKRLDDESAIHANSFKEFTSFTKQLEQMTGFSYDDLSDGELQYNHSRKQLVASRDISEGTILSEADISFRRSEQISDLVASDFESLIGYTAKQHISKGQLFTSSIITKKEG